MFRGLKSLDIIRSALIGGVVGLAGAKALQLVTGSPASISNIVKMNALGNFSLALALGTTVELTGLGILLFSGVRNAVSTNQDTKLKAGNLLFGSAVFAGREVTGAAIGYGLYMLSGNNPGISFTNYLLISALGANLFALTVSLGAQGLTLFGANAAESVVTLLAMNAASIVNDFQQSTAKPLR